MHHATVVLTPAHRLDHSPNLTVQKAAFVPLPPNNVVAARPIALLPLQTRATIVPVHATWKRTPIPVPPRLPRAAVTTQQLTPSTRATAATKGDVFLSQSMTAMPLLTPIAEALSRTTHAVITKKLAPTPRTIAAPVRKLTLVRVTNVANPVTSFARLIFNAPSMNIQSTLNEGFVSAEAYSIVWTDAAVKLLPHPQSALSLSTLAGIPPPLQPACRPAFAAQRKGLAANHAARIKLLETSKPWLERHHTLSMIS